MSCLGSFYNPQPPRAWVRLNSQCLYDVVNHQDNTIVESPLTGKLIPFTLLAHEYQTILKGNILQYKKNASFTKNQLYSQKMTKKRQNIKTTWATQSQTYTNPNNKFLQRIHSKSTTISTKPTDGCALATPPFSSQDGGRLIHRVSQNPCTGETTTSPPCTYCNPTSASDVPGKVQILCLNPKIPTWNPRTTLSMTNSGGNKWPTNAILKSADGRF